jgi:hypothetical protein
MAITTNVPVPTFGPTGYVVPAESAILTGVLADINTAFGGNLNTTNLSSPQGQLASSEAAIIGNTNNIFLFLTNQFDPAYASGRYQDALARLYFLNRNGAQPTVVQAVCSGGYNVPIPTGAQAQAADGNIYTCTAGGTIPIGGSITLPFACNVVGPISCPAGTLNTIYQAIPGWDSITNPTAGVVGQATESTTQFEQRRQATVAANSVNAVASIQGALLSVPGILSAYITENATSSPVTVGGTTLAANSLYVAVSGSAAPSAIANAIWSKKPPGCAYNGNTSYVVSDTSYPVPYPTYTVTWMTPTNLQIAFAINIVSSAAVPSNAATLIQNAIVSAFAGGDGGSIAGIGNLILASRYYSTLAALGSWAQIRTFYVGSANSGSASVLGRISGNTLTIQTVTSGTVAVGQTVTGSLGDITIGTQVTALGSGAGGTGTYVVSTAQSIGATFTAQGTSTVMTASAVSGTISAGYYMANGTGISANTYIIGQLSGTIGGAGTYSVNNILNLPVGVSASANEAMTMVSATLTSVQTNINQQPVTSVGSITVTVT